MTDDNNTPKQPNKAPDSLLAELYEANSIYQHYAQDVLDALHPDLPRLDVHMHADAPDGHFGPERAAQMRVDPVFREQVYDTENDLSTAHALNRIYNAIDTEIDFLAFSDARMRLYRQSNTPLPDAVAKEAAGDIAQSQKRLSQMTVLLDDIQFEPEDEDTWVQQRLQESFEKKADAHLDRLRRGLDAATMRDFFLKRVAGEYLSAAHTFIEAVPLFAAITVLRLETDPATRGSEDHRAAMRAVTHNLECAQTLTAQAVSAHPALLQPAEGFERLRGPAGPKPH